MPRLACFTCGRALWATSPLAWLDVGERRCPRCGAWLQDDRRVGDRRILARRQIRVRISPTGDERRAVDRRIAQQRRSTT